MARRSFLRQLAGLPLIAATSATAVTAPDIVATPQRPPQFEMEIKTTRLTDSLYVLEGAGGNVAAFVWDDGVLLVDDKLAPASPGLKAAVAAISLRPVRFVVNTHWHRDHSGGNEALAGDGSVSVATEGPADRHLHARRDFSSRRGGDLGRSRRPGAYGW